MTKNGSLFSLSHVKKRKTRELERKREQEALNELHM